MTIQTPDAPEPAPTPERPEGVAPAGGAAQRPKDARRKPRRWALRLPASPPEYSTVTTPWLRWPPDWGRELRLDIARWDAEGRLALDLEGSEDPCAELLTARVLGHLDAVLPGAMRACLPSSPYIRFRAETDPLRPAPEVVISVGPEEDARA
jgi:hypothetical protein